jgi:mRNA-degrading endonuclease toxin of MazEF toxin-antitoxin module
VNLKSKKIEGAVLADQVKNFDWQERKAKFIEKCDKKIFKEVLVLTTSLIIN